MNATTATTATKSIAQNKHDLRCRRMQQLKFARAKKQQRMATAIQNQERQIQALEEQRRAREERAWRIRAAITRASEKTKKTLAEKNKKNKKAAAPVLDALADTWIAKAWDVEHGEFGLDAEDEKEEEMPAFAWFAELIAVAAAATAPTTADVRRSPRVVRRVPSRMML